MIITKAYVLLLADDQNGTYAFFVGFLQFMRITT